jgi:hypothetical protein
MNEEMAEYQRGVCWEWRWWTEREPGWNHDHCIGCWATFADIDGPDYLRAGYTTRAEHRNGAGYWWLCEKCFDEHKMRLGWSDGE